MYGQEHEVILKAGRVATIHNAIRLSTLEGEEIDGAVEKLGQALDALLETYRVYVEWKKEKEIERN